MPVTDPNPLDDFHPVVRRWFERTYGEPSPPQRLGWPSISSGTNTLILAPTGSGKTLAAFLWAINHLVEQHLRETIPPGVRILYVSPLKALNNDIDRNLVAPLKGIRDEALAEGLRLPSLHAAVRTGDTPQSKRAAMIKHPPDILITTPESLYLLLTSRAARKMLRTIQYVIIDEIHSICGNKRGVHLSLSLERLQAVAAQEFVRIGLSATQRPLETIAAYLGGYHWAGGTLAPRTVVVVDAGSRRRMDLQVTCPVPDFSLRTQESVWPLLFNELLRQIRSHTTTLIFVNNRRLAERVAARLNEMIVSGESLEGSSNNLYAVPVKTAWSGDTKTERRTGEQLVQAYHGSMSRQARERMESDLKAGTLRALVATSSLELGIDIGTIDLVLQIQSPKGIARGLQRVGRSGHLVTASSTGRILPTHREDLVESAVVARAMMDHDVETTKIPVDCLDVLAQQIVAMVGVEDWETDRMFRLVRQSYCYRTLSRKLFAGVLHMLAGRYTDEAFRGLNARISWDKVNDVLRALPGSMRLAVLGGGTIADRGAYGVYLGDGSTKVGEVDEEFVYESRAGDTFILGTSVWRMTGIDGNRVTVVPAPGEPARMPFWHGEGIGRSYELGKRIGEFRREMAARLDSPDRLLWLQREYPLDRDGAWNILEYFRRQRDATRLIPHDRLLLVEQFRDEIGDPRTVVHSAFGRRVNGLLGLVLLRRINLATGVEPQMLYNDDGILFRGIDSPSTLPTNLLDGLTVHEATDAALEEMYSSPLFGGQFRQNASRALLLPRPFPGRRTPLWLQRLRAGDLLQTVRRHDDFPIVIETVRDVLNDVLDFDHFKELVSGLEQGTIQTAAMTSEVPSPFAAGLLFDFVSAYMYEGDQPRSDRIGQYLAINREILSEVVDIQTLPSIIRPDAILAVEGQLQHTAVGRRARSPEELMEILLRVGDLTVEEIARACADDPRGLLSALRSDRRAIPVQISDGERWVAGEEIGLYNELGSSENLVRVFRRYLETHGPVSPPELATRYGLSADRSRDILVRLSAEPEIVRGRFRSTPGMSEEEWCYRPNLERIHRQSISLLRKEISPCTIEVFTGFLFRWHHLHPDTMLLGDAAPEEVFSQLNALPLSIDIWERDICMRRIRDYVPGMLSRASANGAFLWQGAGSGRMRVLDRGEIDAFSDPMCAAAREQLTEGPRRILAFLERNGASFFNDIRSETHLSLQALNAGIAEIFWAGLVTNDLFSEIMNVKRSAPRSGEIPLERIEVVDPRRNPRRAVFLHAARRAVRQVPGWSGRWSLVRAPDARDAGMTTEERAAVQAAQLLERYGIVAREFHRREDLLPWPLIARELQRLELRGEIRRGYFVQGLSGMQYALPAAVDALRNVQKSRDMKRDIILVNACDPANPYGPGIDLPPQSGTGEPVHVTRLPGNSLAFENGTPLFLAERDGARLQTMRGADEQSTLAALRLFADLIRLPEALRPSREIRIEQINGLPATEAPLADALRMIGFERDRQQTLRIDAYSISMRR